MTEKKTDDPLSVFGKRPEQQPAGFDRLPTEPPARFRKGGEQEEPKPVKPNPASTPTSKSKHSWGRRAAPARLNVRCSAETVALFERLAASHVPGQSQGDALHALLEAAEASLAKD